MMLGTHAALPLIGVTALDIYRISSNKDRLTTNWQLFFIGIGGILPDLLWPHFSMEGRLSSYTHTLWFILLLIPVTYWISRKMNSKNVLFFSVVFVFAALLHIVTDAISGGVSFFYPIKGVWGTRLVPYYLWFEADMIFLSIALILNLIRYRLGTLKIRSVD